MKLIKKKDFFDNGIHTKKYYFCGIRYLKKIWSSSFRETYLFKFKISDHNIKKYIKNFYPSVTIIVPNYNHEKFLKKRLDSIYSQTYKNYKVILLDDCSSDNSRKILNQYQKKHKDNTKCVFNDCNSGGVFYQWANALKKVDTDLVWIAESDDYCDNNFLKTMIDKFHDESVMLAFCRTDFVKNDKKVWTTEEYLSDIKYNFNSDFTDTVNNLINNGFAYKNFICNVSSCVFRNTGFESILKNKDWYKMKVCGDWMFYLDIARGGCIAYTSKTTNYYRQHDNNTSVSSHTKEFFYKEHEFISEYICKNYDVNKSNFIRLYNILEQIYKNNKVHGKQLKSLYDIEKINKIKRKNKNIMIVSYGFYIGGGETFPIYLANELKKSGHNITFSVFDNSCHEQGIKALLRKDIPIIYEHNWFDLFLSFGIDAVYSGYLGVDFDIAKSARPKKCKHFVTLHGMYECMDDSTLNFCIPTLVSTVNKWIYIADKNLIPFKQRDVEINDDFIKLPNGLPDVDIKPIKRKNLNIPEKAFVLSVVSRGIPEKGWAEAIEAVKLSRQKTGKNIHLIICGDGEMYNKLMLEQQPEFIHMVGFQKNTRDYIATSDALLLASYFKGESFPLCIIDALFCGKPVIATNIGEVKNMLTVDKSVCGTVINLDSNGKVDIQKLADAISDFFEKNNKNKYKKMIAVLQKKYKIENVGKEYEKIYIST